MQTNRRVSERTHDLSSTVDNRSRKLSRLLGERITDRHGNICRTFVNMEETQESCMFCTIASDQDKDTEIILQNDKLVCFRDIYPAAPHHYLVIPREHILSCLSLDKEHVGLVERMADMGKCALREQGITDMKDIRLGFHQPPYTSVDHLHLHVLAPASQISEYMEYKFLPNTQRFIEEQCLLKWLKDSPSRNSIKCAFGVHQTTQKNVLNELMLKLKLK